ncbi:hypothetical protein APHAL10511_006035 [Amanita phalloides]|nr:hypothetical protein APHAL10511_006035 [Amanita phalloides]
MPNIDLPVGSRLGWELDNTVERDLLHSISDSAVLVRSLRQSRERWLLSTFPKFSSKARQSKSAEAHPVPPPHTIQMRGHCDVEIGPHIFSDTVFYEVHYLPTEPSSVPSSSTTRPYQSSWQSVTPYGSTYLQSTPAPSVSLDSSALASVSPDLINQVNLAASSNPILASLLQVAAGGSASQEQLKTLGLLIQSLSSRDSGSAGKQQPSANLPSSLLVTQPPIKPFDVVVEFREMPNVRWLFPRGPTVCERIMDNVANSPLCDVVITTCIPFKKTVEKTSGASEQPAAESQSQPEKTPQAVKLSLKKAPITVWDTLYRWVGGEQEMTKHREYLQSLEGPKRAYLGHQLLDGSLLTQLQSVSKNVYPMKLLKPGQHSSRSSKKRSAPRKEPELSSKQGDGTPSAKQRRRSQPAKRAPTQILCQTCGTVNVPLIQGGRYCRPCVDSGKAKVDELQISSGAEPTSSQAEATKSPIFIHSAYSSQAQDTPAAESADHVA